MTRATRYRCGLAAVLLAGVACTHEPAGGPAGSTTLTGSPAGTAGMGGSTATGGSAGAAATGGGGGGGGGGGAAGGHAPVGALVDTGLIVRYYIDERADGQGNAELVDAAPDPLPLQMTWGSEVNYFEDSAGNRGLEWTEIELDSRASVATAGTKISSGLHGSTTGTIEVVAEIEAVTSSHSRLSHIGVDSSSGSFTLSMPSVTRIQFYKIDPSQGDDVLRGRYEIDFITVGRFVVHLVYDSTEADPEDRAKLYLNGAVQPRLEGTPPALGEVIDIGVDNHYVLGNREIGQRTFVGKLYYGAMYSAALTDAEVLQNTGVLLVDDDTPATSPPSP